jgi:hypothetical protein
MRYLKFRIIKLPYVDRLEACNLLFLVIACDRRLDFSSMSAKLGILANLTHSSRDDAHHYVVAWRLRLATGPFLRAFVSAPTDAIWKEYPVYKESIVNFTWSQHR